MKYGKTIASAVLALCLQQAALANETPANALSAEETNLAFNVGEKTPQVAALSAEEMEKTQGAYLPSYYYGWSPSYAKYAYGGTSQIGMSIIRTVTANHYSGTNYIANLNMAMSKH